MVATQEHVGHTVILPFPGKYLRTGVDIATCNTTLLDGGVFAQNAGDTASDAVEHDHCRQFSAGQSVRTDRDRLCTEYFLDTCVHTFVAAADHDEMLVLGLDFVCIRSVELRTLRLEKDHLHILAVFATERLLCGTQHALRLEHHTGATAVRSAIDALVLVFGKVAWVVEGDFDLLALDRTLHNRLTKVRVECRGEKGDDVEVHGYNTS